MNFQTLLDEDYALFVQRLKSITGLDLNMYRELQMRRRLNTLRKMLGYS